MLSPHVITAVIQNISNRMGKRTTMTTKKQKREAGIRKQAENLAKVTAERLEAQRRDQERREQKERETQEEIDRVDVKHGFTPMPKLSPENEKIRRLQISRKLAERK